MTVTELIEQLECYPDDTEVRIAIQPSWPLQFAVGAVTDTDEVAGETRCDEHDNYSCDECAGEPVVWLAAGDECEDPYAPSGVFARAVL